MSDLSAAPLWIKNDIKNPYFYDGDEFLVATLVTNNVTNTENWEFYKIRALADERLDWINIETEESFDAWDWDDVDFYIPINADGPMTSKAYESTL